MNSMDGLKQAWEAKTIITDQICEKHGINLVTLKADNYTACRLCHKEKREAENAVVVEKLYRESLESKRLYYLKDFSLMDEELEKATFANFRVDSEARKQDLDFVKSVGRGYLKGRKGNVVLVGDPGVGKSHLAYSLIKAISEHNNSLCAIVNVVDLMAKIREDFSLESYYVNKLAELDYLVLDDLGTEKITEWSSGILYSVLNKRVKTIVTSNLTREELLDEYGKRIYSRIFKGVGDDYYHVMENQADERTKGWF